LNLAKHDKEVENPMITPARSPHVDAALSYAELGYKVFPCAVIGKTPATENGVLDATTAPEQIEQWWQETPMANIGICTMGLLAVDIDGADNPWLAG
jgi:hypothetical protein